MCKLSLISLVRGTAEVGGRRDSWLCSWLSMNGRSVRNHLRANGWAPERRYVHFGGRKRRYWGQLGEGFSLIVHPKPTSGTDIVDTILFFFIFLVDLSIDCVFPKECIIPMHKLPILPKEMKARK
jgi:hypothetical protein